MRQVLDTVTGGQLDAAVDLRDRSSGVGVGDHQPPQALALNETVHLVVVQIGGNDFGFVRAADVASLGQPPAIPDHDGQRPEHGFDAESTVTE